MYPRRFAVAARRVLVAALVAPFLTSCWGDLVTNETIGSPAVPSGGAMFQRYVALGTSIGTGIQSAGINDSTQRQSFVLLLARAMGHTLGTTFRYPSFTNPGCPPPFTNPLTGARVTPPGFPTSTSMSCYVRAAGSVASAVNNLSIPSLRAMQVLNVGDLSFPATDTLKLAQFITGGRNPADVMDQIRPTFVTLEVGANDVLGAATRGDSTLLTDTAGFRTTFDAIAGRIAATGARAAVSNVPDVAVIPNLSAGRWYYILKFVAPTPPFNSPLFTVNPSCAPGPLAIGDSTLFPFSTTGGILKVLSGGRAATVNCALGTADTVGTALPVLSAAERKAVRQRVNELNAIIAQEVASRGWALVDLNGELLLQLGRGQIPAFPSLSTPTTTLFGPLFSLDGVHPNAAGHKLIARAFAAAINATYATSLVVQ